MSLRDFCIIGLPVKKHRAFFREFERLTAQEFAAGGPVPFPVKGTRRYERSVLIQLLDLPHRNGVCIGTISVRERGKGHGSMGLRFLCSLADKHSVTLVGDASARYEWEDEPTGPGLNYEQLRAWYRRYGFVFEPGSNKMRREPQRFSAEIRTLLSSPPRNKSEGL